MTHRTIQMKTPLHWCAKAFGGKRYSLRLCRSRGLSSAQAEQTHNIRCEDFAEQDNAEADADRRRHDEVAGSVLQRKEHYAGGKEVA